MQMENKENILTFAVSFFFNARNSAIFGTSDKPSVDI